MKLIELSREIKQPIEVYPVTDESYIVYLLLKNGNIVYVGKSDYTNMPGRIKAHKRDKDFDSYSIFRVFPTAGAALKFEAGLIGTIKPIYNRKEIETEFGNIAFCILQMFLQPEQKEIDQRDVRFVPWHFQYTQNGRVFATMSMGLMLFGILAFTAVVADTAAFMLFKQPILFSSYYSVIDWLIKP